MGKGTGLPGGGSDWGKEGLTDRGGLAREVHVGQGGGARSTRTGGGVEDLKVLGGGRMSG